MSYIVPAILIFTIYTTFFLEIDLYYAKLIKPTTWEYFQIMNFRTIWLLNYSLFFVAVLSFVNLKKVKNQILGRVSIVLSIIAIFTFLTVGLFELGELREDYLDHSAVNPPALNITIRYISFLFFALTMFATFLYTKASFISKKFDTLFDVLFHFSMLWIISSEFLHWMNIAHATEDYKILSILWGIYALLLIVLGIWKKKKHLRISAMVLFGVTLIKLFIYDITHFGTIGKTIVFISLGIILLTISFLYNKYKRIISD